MGTQIKQFETNNDRMRLFIQINKVDNDLTISGSDITGTGKIVGVTGITPARFEILQPDGTTEVSSAACVEVDATNQPGKYMAYPKAATVAMLGCGSASFQDADGNVGHTEFEIVGFDPYAVEIKGSIASTDNSTFTVAFVPDIAEADFGQQALNQFAGAKLRLESIGSVSDGGCPGVEIPILESSWGAGYSITLQLPNTAFVAAIIDNIVDAKASIVNGPDAWQYQSPTWPILRLKVDNSLSDATPTSFKLKDGQDPVPTDEKQIKNGRFTITTAGDNFKVAGKTVAGFDAGTSTMTVNTALPAAPVDDDDVLIIP